MRWNTFCAVAALGLAACDDPTQPTAPPTTVSLSASASEHHEQEVRHFRSNCQTSIIFTSPTTLHITYDCQFRGLGKRFRHARGRADQTLGPNGAISNLTVYTFGNGNHLLASFVGTASPPDANGVLAFTGSETFTGGAGRFTRASGSDDMTGTASLVTNTGQFRTHGHLKLQEREIE